jgi:hypothetical protein
MRQRGIDVNEAAYNSSGETSDQPTSNIPLAEFQVHRCAHEYVAALRVHDTTNFHIFELLPVLAVDGFEKITG